jgi:hypothetical protein
MDTETAAVSNCKFDWADDDDEDFDLERWKATADTSAPTAAELGPLQVPPTEDKTDDREETYTLSRIRNERACWDPSVAEEPSDAGLIQEPVPIAQLPAEYWHLAVLNCRPEHQVMSARFVRITRAIGLRYDGKEEPEAPAYPELSDSKTCRSNYMKRFQNWKIEHRSLSCSNVYRKSPLNIATPIENAHEIDNLVDSADEEAEEVLDEYEAMQIFAFELEEQDQASVSDQPECNQEADREMNEEIDRMLVDQSKNDVDISQRFSRKQLEDLYRQYKAEQLQIAESGTEELFAKVRLDTIEEEDTASIDSWEASSCDEEDPEPCPSCSENDEMALLVAHPVEDDETFSLATHPFDAAATEEELDFDNVVFGSEDEAQDSMAETKSETDSEPSDEGYASSSPPVTPILESSRILGKRHTQDGFIPAEMRLSSSSMRRKTKCWTESMDALNAFRQMARNEQYVDDVFEEDEDDEVLERVQGEPNLKDELRELSEATKDAKFTLVVVPPQEEDKIKVCPLSDLAMILAEQSNTAGAVEEDDQIYLIDDERRGILDVSFAFPGPPAGRSTSALKSTSAATSTATSPKRSVSSSSARRWTDPPKYIPDPPSVVLSSATRHKKQNSLSLDHLASAVTKSRFYMCELPWKQVVIMTAGVVAGGFLSMARRH